MTAPEFHHAEDAEERGQGICRTCLAPIWREQGTVGHQTRHGWSDRIERGGDSLVCFKAVGYRHVPLDSREACIYDRAFQRGAEQAGTDERARIVWWIRAGLDGPAAVGMSGIHKALLAELAEAIEQHPERFADAPTGRAS